MKRGQQAPPSNWPAWITSAKSVFANFDASIDFVDTKNALCNGGHESGPKTVAEVKPLSWSGASFTASGTTSDGIVYSAGGAVDATAQTVSNVRWQGTAVIQDNTPPYHLTKTYKEDFTLSKLPLSDPYMGKFDAHDAAAGSAVNYTGTLTIYDKDIQTTKTCTAKVSAITYAGVQFSQ